MMTSMILTDFLKAFDSIEHDLLLQKLYAIGFSKHTVNRFKSYLSKRSFLVNLGNISFHKISARSITGFTPCLP